MTATNANFIIGLDIGGANIKLATSKGEAITIPFELWRQPDGLGAQLRETAGRYMLPTLIVITMTGELCDCFQTKRQGVSRIIQNILQGWPELKPEQFQIWSTHGRFLNIEEACKDALQVAAANWHALATCLAKRYAGRSVLIDTGSTTTDILWLENGSCRATGKTDMDRLSSGELVYLGAGRTPVMALGPSVTWMGGRQFSVMNELFADVRDLWLVMGVRPDQPDDVQTWDKRPATRAYAAERVLRMVGADSELADTFESSALAHSFAQIHAERIASAVRKVIAGRRPDRVILSGSGEFAAGFGADRVESLEGITRVRLSETIGAKQSDAGCAWALIELARTKATP